MAFPGPVQIRIRNLAVIKKLIDALEHHIITSQK
jgi:hypothetical protein